MTVHAESVIPTWVNDYYPDFYVSLTDKENDCYTRNGGNKKTEWIAQFTTLVTALNNWKNVGRNDKVSDVVSFIYTYRILGLNFGYDQSKLPELDALYIFSMNDFMTTTIGRAVDYYNDLDSNNQSARIASSITTINNYASMENTRLSNIQSYAKAAASNFSSKALFQDIEASGSAGKAEMKVEIFTNLKFKRVYQLLTTLELPPGV